MSLIDPTGFTPEQLEALKAAGGCDHTPNPFNACDTCGRKAAKGAHVKRTVAYDWEARSVDGTLFAKKEWGSISNIPRDAICELVVATDNPRIPKVKVRIDPRKGELLNMFTRHCFNAGPNPRSLSIPIFEIQYEGTDHKVRLYLHPIQGPILSTEDLYF